MVTAPFFSPSTVTKMQRLQESSLIDSAIIRHSEAISDGAGGTTELVTFTIAVPCRVGISRLQRGEILVAGRLQGNIPSEISFSVTVDIRESDRINVGGTLVDTEIVGGVLYEVLALYFPSSYSSVRTCLCAKRS